MNSDNFNNQRRLNSMLSLCKRAGQLASGESNCENAIRSKKAGLIILSGDASKNTIKKFVNSSNYYNIPIYIIKLSKKAMGSIIGESDRAVITIIGDGFMEELKLCLEKFEYGGGGPIV